MPTIADELRAKAAAMRANAEKLLAAAAVLDSADQIANPMVRSPAPIAAPPQAPKAGSGIIPDGPAITAAVRAISNKGMPISLPEVVHELTNRGYEVTADVRARTSTILNRMERREELVKVVQGSGSTPNVYTTKEAEKG